MESNKTKGNKIYTLDKVKVSLGLKIILMSGALIAVICIAFGLASINTSKNALVAVEEEALQSQSKLMATLT